MLKEIRECLTLKDDCEQKFSNKADAEKGLIILVAFLRFAIAQMYISAISILPIYIVDSNECHIGEIYGKLFNNVNWDAIVLINILLFTIMSISEYLEAVSEKRNKKIIYTTLSIAGLIINALTTILPMAVYGRIELIKNQNIELKYGMIIILLLFLMVAMPVVIRTVNQVNLRVFYSWYKKGRKLSYMERRLVLLAEVVIAMVIMREIFVTAVSALL